MSDLSDGTVLVELAQALTGERLCGVLPHPKTRDHAVENIQLALNALEADGTEFGGAEAGKVHDGDQLQILRLLWIVILRYQVTGYYL